MPDVLNLTGPNGSSLNVASFVIEPGVDFGEADLVTANYSESPAADGGFLAFEHAGIRRMQFPLRIASVSAFGGALGLQSWLRTLARPGATLDIQLDGVPTAEAVRFDVNTGRLEVGQWNQQLYAQTDRLEATLKLDTQPYGYWPTMILLASSASVGGPGVLSLDTSKLIGDAPGLAELFIAPTSATGYAGTSYKTDSVFWSLSMAPSAQAFWPPASTLGVGSDLFWTPTLTADQFAPASQSLRYWIASGATSQFPQAGWMAMAAWVVPPNLEPAYRGRFRAFAWTKLGPSQAFPFYASLDSTAGTTVQAPLASAQPVATVPVAVSSSAVPGLTAGASPGYSLLDLGVISLPPVASRGFETQLRLWLSAPTILGIAATAQLDIGGLYLQPLEGAAGVLARGLAQPPLPLKIGGVVRSPSVLGRLLLSAVTNEQVISSATSTVASLAPVAQALTYHRGVLPLVGASTIQLDLNLAGRQTSSATYPVFLSRTEPHFAQVSVRYRPRFMFQKGL